MNFSKKSYGRRSRFKSPVLSWLSGSSNVKEENVPSASTMFEITRVTMAGRGVNLPQRYTYVSRQHSTKLAAAPRSWSAD